MTFIILFFSMFPPICMVPPKDLVKEKAGPVIVVTTSTGIVQKTEGYTFLRVTGGLNFERMRWERASVAVQIAISKKPLAYQGILREYVAGSFAFLDNINFFLKSVPEISLDATIDKFINAKTYQEKKRYGDYLVAVVANKTNHCSFRR
jgi:hypothetical protein